jgi:hypothetical protein
VDLGTSLVSADTDGDGLDDYLEWRDDALDPLNADSDGDGLLDPDEVALGTRVAIRDSDGDGVTDGLEVQLGYDPRDPWVFGPALCPLGTTPPSAVPRRTSTWASRSPGTGNIGL